MSHLESSWKLFMRWWLWVVIIDLDIVSISIIEVLFSIVWHICALTFSRTNSLGAHDSSHARVGLNYTPDSRASSRILIKVFSAPSYRWIFVLALLWICCMIMIPTTRSSNLKRINCRRRCRPLYWRFVGRRNTTVLLRTFFSSITLSMKWIWLLSYKYESMLL